MENRERNWENEEEQRGKSREGLANRRKRVAGIEKKADESVG